MVPSSFNNYSELLDLFISRERRLSHKIREEDIIVRKIGITLEMFDRLKRGYIPNYKSKSTIVLRRYLETNYNYTFIYQKGSIITQELPPVPRTDKEKRMATKIDNLVSKVKLLEIENNYLRNRLKENS